MTPDPAEEELRLHAAQCPVLKGAYRSGDPEVVAKVLEMHPPSRCPHVRMAEAAK